MIIMPKFVEFLELLEKRIKNSYFQISKSGEILKKTKQKKTKKNSVYQLNQRHILASYIKSTA